MMNNAIDIDAGKDVHESMNLTNTVGETAGVTVIARAGLSEFPFVMLYSTGINVTVHMLPEEARALGQLLIDAGYRASWTLVDVAALEAC